MAFFDRFRPTGRPSPHPEKIKPALDTIIAFCNDVVQRIGETQFSEDSMEKQVLSVYAFGGIHVLSQQESLAAAEGHAICLALLVQFFGYSPEASAAKAQALIEAAGDKTSHLNSIIHRGIDGFLAWQKNRTSFDATDFVEVLTAMKDAS